MRKGFLGRKPIRRREMRHLKAIFALAYFVLAMANFVFSDVLKVRVTASQANIRLKATW